LLIVDFGLLIEKQGQHHCQCQTIFNRQSKISNQQFL